MAISASQGPLVVWGQNQPAANYNQDIGPSVWYAGNALYDSRFAYRQDSPGPTGVRCYGFYMGGGIVALDQIPSKAQTFNIVAPANVTSGTALTLVTVASGGIAPVATALTIPQTGNIVPAAAVSIDGTPGLIAYGQTGGVTLVDPTTTIARAVQVTAASGAAGGDFKVSGFDLYGAPMTEVITAGVGVNSVSGKKAFKFINSVVPSFTNAINYSVGTTDVIGTPLRVDKYAYVSVAYSDTPQTTSAGFVAALSTSPSSSTTADVRGTYQLQVASDGIKRLQMFIELAPAAVSNPNDVTPIFGVTQA